MKKPPKPVLIRRQEATQATVDRFVNRPLVWSTNDCARMAAFHARKMGYKTPMPKAGSYRNPRAAIKALRDVTGHTRIEEVLEHYMGFIPIPYAMALMGDLCTMPSADDEDWAALFVVLDNGRLLGFLADGDAMECRVAVPIPERVQGAWRLEPR